MDGTIGEIRLFAAAFAPKNWWYCDGSLIAIRTNTALFSILGTYYGGDGKTTFGLPDLKGRTVLGAGQGPGLSSYELGQMDGANSITLTNAELPSHTHVSVGNISVPAYSDEGDSPDPNQNILAAKANMYSTTGVDTAMKASAYTVEVSLTGGNQPLALNQPSLGMNYIICMYGNFPPRG
jgi:microcystin-dependent protein